MYIRFNYTQNVIKKSKPPQNKPFIFGELEKNTIYTFSGKSSLTLLLRYFKDSGQLKNKTDQILVPEWLGSWVYMTMQKYCFLTTVMNPKVKGVLAYHQWGFPQKMDEILEFCKNNGLFCIEDCAHAFDSYYKEKRLGTFSDAAVFSLAKFFPSVVGGAVYSANKNILEFIKKMQSDHKPVFADQAFKQRVIFDSHPDDKINQIKLGQSYAVYDELSCCPDYSLSVVEVQLKGGAIEKRRANFQILKEAFGKGKYEKDLFKENVLPWVVPLFFSRSTNRQVAEALKRAKIESGIYHFDINRNVFEPDFKECVVVPCHQGIPQNKILEIVEIIRKAI